ncbi:MAG TPA: heat-shock protein Hsp20 [Desulfobacteraceae bacterium]|nr:heat-shock protein Hsp20 [Desulfobacteraceae bacterium]
MIMRRISSWPKWETRSPFEDVDLMRKEINRLFGGLADSTFRGPSAGVFPLLNITEDNNNYYARAELPGTKTDELDISITGNSLSIAGERKIPSENESANYHRREREAGKFSRITTLPGQVDTAKSEARCVDGILTIVLPKAESAKPKQITVKTS